MQPAADCIPCMFQQALNTARVVTDDPKVHEEVLRRLAAHVAAGGHRGSDPAAISKPAYDIVAEVTGVRDPYAAAKRESNQEALQLLPELERMDAAARDPLAAAVHLAAAGNLIDFGIGHAAPGSIAEEVRALLQRPFAIDDIGDFREELRPGRKLVYLGDNAGEIVFDRVLVERIQEQGVEVVFTVKSGPIINDAIMEDARVAGLTDLVRVVETGSDDVGVHWEHCSAEFREALDAADVVVSKGQGNFETCHGRLPNAYFLLKAKCKLVAAALGVTLGDIVFKHERIA